MNEEELVPNVVPGSVPDWAGEHCGTVLALCVSADVIVESAFDKLVDSDGMLDFNPDNAA